MGESDFCICRDCEEIVLLEHYEQIEWIKKHKGHDWNVLHDLWAEDLDTLKKELADLLHFNREEVE